MTEPGLQPRRIVYVTGTRADFGLMRSTLALIDASPKLSLSTIVTGMHLDARFGNTVAEVEDAGFRIAARIPLPAETPSGAAMARGIGLMTMGVVGALQQEQPDLVLLLGDRGEMLAGAIAAIHLNIPIAHIAGGDRSGTVDEPIRHAVSKLAHFHFTSTELSAERLIRMGEDPQHVFVTGTPSLDDIVGKTGIPRDKLAAELGIAADAGFILLAYHPVLQDADKAGEECARILRALGQLGRTVVALLPNSDAGSDAIRLELENASRAGAVVLKTHLRRPLFLAAMAHCDLMVGNSSSGIVEAASFGTPVINLGPRQAYRERNSNVIDVEIDDAAVTEAARAALLGGRLEPHNIYGNGNAGAQICGLLEQIELSPAILRKVNCY